MKSDLPFGSEFSPSQIVLADALELARAHGGDSKAFETAMMQRYFATNRTDLHNRRKLAMNARLGMIAYGVIDRDAALTAFGEQLYSLRNDEPRLYAELGRHILLNLGGATFVQCVQDMQAAGETVELVSLRRALGERGIHVPRGGKHPSIMRLWLEQAGVFVQGWRVDETRLRSLLGASMDDLDALSALTVEQRAYVRTILNLGGPGPYASNDVEKLASATYGVRFNEKNLPKSVLYPLRDKGFILLERGTKQPGRGAKPFMLTPTPRLTREIAGPLLEQVEKLIASEIRPLLRKPIAQILNELSSTNRHVAGHALEALAHKLMRLIDLNHVATRRRGSVTGGTRADLVFESRRLALPRWLVPKQALIKGLLPARAVGGAGA